MASNGKNGKGSFGWLWIVALIVLLGGGLGGILLVLGLGVLLLLALVLAGVLLSKKDEEGQAVSGSSSSQAEANMPPEDRDILSQARRDMTELRVTAARVELAEVRTAATEAAQEIEKIIGSLKAQPEDIRGAQLFLQYSLPTAGKLLKKFEQMEKNGVADPETSYKVLAYMREVKAAANKTLRGIYEDDVADIDAELEVLRQSYESMGL